MERLVPTAEGAQEMKPLHEMANDEFLEYVVKEGLKGWIPLRAYTRFFPEESRSAVETRIKRRHWKRGVHYSTPEGANMWVNVIAIGEWVAAGGLKV